ncbi:MAG: hypothetical protein NT080_02735 [Spirochaetes bacterium]|nr:hypothetical protein [Spirochaetota bacterium]
MTERDRGTSGARRARDDDAFRDANLFRDAWDFAQVEEFWASYSPLTPYGRDDRDERKILSDAGLIEESWDLTERALAFEASCRDDAASLDRVRFHLRRMPRLPLEAKDAYGLVEIFQVKKFLANARAVSRLVDHATRSAFGLGFTLQNLAAELDKGGSDAETFFMADAFHPGLPEVRAEAADADRRAEALQGEISARIEERFGIRLDGRAFVVVPQADARPLAAERGPWVVEPYDDDSWVIRPAPDAGLLAVMEERERIADRERELEDEVTSMLSVLIAGCMPAIRALVAAVARFDLAFARAKLAREYGLVRPRLAADADGAGSEAPIDVVRGRFMPCERSCSALGLVYEPFTARFDETVTVLFGSNMGGKTIALKTIMFLQLIAQAGLFVPASSFTTRVYRRLHYVGELSGERLDGLSGFGFEIRRFIEAFGMIGEGALVVFDEFARTTSSGEAEALLSAVIAELSQRKGSRSFFATHFRGVARLPGVSYRRMLGLDRESAGVSLDEDAPLAERLAGINCHMRYEIVGDDGLPCASDALAVAAMLGLDPCIIARAEAYYGGRDGLPENPRVP